MSPKGQHRPKGHTPGGPGGAAERRERHSRGRRAEGGCKEEVKAANEPKGAAPPQGAHPGRSGGRCPREEEYGQRGSKRQERQGGRYYKERVDAAHKAKEGAKNKIEGNSTFSTVEGAAGL